MLNIIYKCLNTLTLIWNLAALNGKVHEFSASIEKTGRRVRNLKTRAYLDEPDLSNIDKIAENILLLTK